MRFNANANALLKALFSAALLTSLGAQATSLLDPVRAPTAAKQDFATHLALADLSKQGIVNPTTAELGAVVNSIQAQRTSGMGWGEIAHSLGLKLGPVVSAVNRGKHADHAKYSELADSRKSKNKGKDRSLSRAEDKANRTRAERSESHGSKGNSSSGGGKGNGNGNGGGGGKK